MRPRDAEALCLLGDAHFEKKDFTKALESYKVQKLVQTKSEERLTGPHLGTLNNKLVRFN